MFGNHFKAIGGMGFGGFVAVLGVIILIVGIAVKVWPLIEAALAQ